MDAKALRTPDIVDQPTMFTPNQYELIDFGAGRKLERFGAYLIDRPCPAAEGLPRAQSNGWRRAAARFSGRQGQTSQWRSDAAMPKRWTIAHRNLSFELCPTRVGQLGIFPEQATCWDWIAAQLARGEQDREDPDLADRQTARGQNPTRHGTALQGARRGCNRTSETLPLDREERTHDPVVSQPLKVLNLFAYTGGSSLAAAAAGAQVVHIDAAKSSVSRARVNAGLSHLTAAPIRWIVEDALRFTTRELRRGNRYDAVILDPPSYGHGPQGQPWKLAEHLPALLRQCGELTAGRLAFVLLTCHTPGFGPDALADHLARAALCGPNSPLDTGPLELTTADGRTLPSGQFARWPARL
jgi:23S rRNA (cytosine1962-C5)-methyltransferase